MLTRLTNCMLCSVKRRPLPDKHYCFETILYVWLTMMNQITALLCSVRQSIHMLLLDVDNSFQCQ